MKNKKDSTTKVKSAVSDMVEVMKIKISNAIVENSRDLNLESESVRKLNYIITETITNSYVNSLEKIVNASKK
jgi:hypothetical protein